MKPVYMINGFLESGKNRIYYLYIVPTVFSH